MPSYDLDWAIQPGAERLPVVAIDGPAGAGKSTVARLVARALGWPFMDTGAMYRAITLAALDRGIDPRRADSDTIATLSDEVHLTVTLSDEGTQVAIDGTDVTDRIRSPAVSDAIGPIADHPVVRRKLAQIQRNLGVGCPLVTEGRDQGTAVFPDARHKIFLVASVDVRARRRHADYAAAGKSIEIDEVRAAVARRDDEDRARPVGALVKAPDAVEIDTSSMSSEQVVETIVSYVEHRGGSGRFVKVPPY